MPSNPRIPSAGWILVPGLVLSACTSFLNPATPTPLPPTATPVPPTATPPPSVATVNGEYLTSAEFQAELARYQAAQAALGNAIPDEAARQAVLDDLVGQMLLAQAAREAGFELGEADLQARLDGLAADLGGPEALAQWQSAHGYDEASFRAALRRAAEAAWMRDRIVSDVPASVEQIHLRQILTYNEADANYALQQLQNGTEFDELAALYDPITRGELGWVPQGYLLDPRADEAVFALQAGATSGIIATDAGFHIFKALDRGEHPLTPDARLSVQERTLADWLEQRRAEGAIVLIP